MSVQFLRKCFLILIALFGLQTSYAEDCDLLLSGQSFPDQRLSESLAASGISERELSAYVASKITEVPEFNFIQKTAQQMGIEVYLFGGTASSFVHYSKWDLARSKGLMDLQPDRFDYDFTNIFRSTQDLDIVVDSTPDVAKNFQDVLKLKYPKFLGSKSNGWEVRTLRYRILGPGQIGYKEALLDDFDFNNQDTDSNSLAMVNISVHPKHSIIQDLKNWEKSKNTFLSDAVNNRITYLRNPRHFETSRASKGENPEILSVIRLLVKSFQYELNFSKIDFNVMKQITSEFDPKSISNPVVKRRLNDTAKKLVLHAVNIEYAINKLDELGLRKKLIALGDINDPESCAFWLNKEPLRSKPVGTGSGKTAQELGIDIVSHGTNSFFAFESITRSHTGEPNVYISRNDVPGEAAALGNGFYTAPGRLGGRGNVRTIRFKVDPIAREGSDFFVGRKSPDSPEEIVWENKKALRVIPESFNLGVDELIEKASTNESLDLHDLALIEIFRRKTNNTKFYQELSTLLTSNSGADRDKLIKFLFVFQNTKDFQTKALLPESVFEEVSQRVFKSLRELRKSQTNAAVITYLQQLNSILPTLDRFNILKRIEFVEECKQLVRDQNRSFALRKSAYIELILSSSEGAVITNHGYLLENIESLKEAISSFSPLEKQKIQKDFVQFSSSSDDRKIKFFKILENYLRKILQQDQVTALENIEKLHIFDVNYRSVSEKSLLLLSVYYRAKKTIQQLITFKDFDLTQKNRLGYTDTEQLRLLGHVDLADQIESLRPESKSRQFSVAERNSDGSPIIDFVRIEPGVYYKGEPGFSSLLQSSQKVLTKISSPYEIASTETSQKQWTELTRLMKLNIRGFEDLKEEPSYLRGDSNPVESVSFDQVSKWITGLNELSKIKDDRLQKNILALLPGHFLNAEYKLPSWAEWEFVARNDGLAEGTYSFGMDDSDLDLYSFYQGNRQFNKPRPLGSKKPMLYYGKPIYDLQGNVDEWVGDSVLSSARNSITSGVPNRIACGGSFSTFPHLLSIESTREFESSHRSEREGFRLARVVPVK